MNIENNPQKDIIAFGRMTKNESVIDQKLNELIDMLAETDIDSKTGREYQRRFSHAVEKAITEHKRMPAFGRLENRGDHYRTEHLEELTIPLSQQKISSRIYSNYIKNERIRKGVLITIGIILIVLGFAMIVMPAPPYFEMFTIYYFNPNDGITLMDLISLLVVFSGVYLFIRALTKPLKLKDIIPEEE